MYPGRYGRRNVVNLCPGPPFFGGVGLLVQILDVDAAPTLFECLVGVFVGVWVTSPRPISTGRLGIAAVHLRPINPVVCGWPYPIVWVGNLILKCASRLDAFSGYHVRT